MFGAGSGPAQRGCWESTDRGGTPVGDPQGDREREERQGEEDPRTGEVRQGWNDEVERVKNINLCSFLNLQSD